MLICEWNTGLVWQTWRRLTSESLTPHIRPFDGRIFSSWWWCEVPTEPYRGLARQEPRAAGHDAKMRPHPTALDFIALGARLVGPLQNLPILKGLGRPTLADICEKGAAWAGATPAAAVLSVRYSVTNPCVLGQGKEKGIPTPMPFASTAWSFDLSETSPGAAVKDPDCNAPSQMESQRIPW